VPPIVARLQFLENLRLRHVGADADQPQLADLLLEGHALDQAVDERLLVVQRGRLGGKGGVHEKSGEQTEHRESFHQRQLGFHRESRCCGKVRPLRPLCEASAPQDACDHTERSAQKYDAPDPGQTRGASPIRRRTERPYARPAFSRKERRTSGQPARRVQQCRAGARH